MFVLKIGDRLYPITKDVTKIGRHTSNDIILGETRVSRFHSEVVIINGRIFLLDKNTINGTFIGDKRILTDREILLKPGDFIGIGAVAKEFQELTLEVELSPDEPPPNEYNEVVSTTTDSDSNRNSPDSPGNDELNGVNQLPEELLELLLSDECSVPPQQGANKPEEHPLLHRPTVNEPPVPVPSCSRQSETSSCHLVKSEPATGSSVKSTNMPSLFSPQTAEVRIKQSPKKDINSPVKESSIVDPLGGAASITDVLKNHCISFIEQLLAQKLSETNVLPSLLNISNQNAALSSENSSSQTSNASADVKEKPSTKEFWQHSSLAADVSERKCVKTELKNSNVNAVDELAAAAVATAKIESIKVDLSEEPENDVMEIIDVPAVASTEVMRPKSSSNMKELAKQPPISPEPITRSFREDDTMRLRLSEAIINLCDANEGADDVIEISDEESGDKCYRSRKNRKIIDPNTIVIEDTKDDEEKSENLEQCSEKAVVTTALAPAKPVVSNGSKGDSSKLLLPDCVQKVESSQPALTIPVKQSPNKRSKIERQEPNLSAPLDHSSSNKLKVELQQPIDLDSVQNPSCNKRQVQCAPVTVTTPMKLPTSERQNVLLEQPIINIPAKNSCTDQPDSEFFQSIIEPSSGQGVAFQERKPVVPADSSPGPSETVVAISTESLPTNAPPTSSFIDLSEDEKPLARIKCEPLAPSSYSNFDEIIALDSDDEDFPLSQLNTTQINDVPDFSSTFERMFDDNDYVKEEPHVLQCNEYTWFEPFSQTEMVEGKHVARMQSSTFQSDDVMTEEELQCILDEQPDGVVELELEEPGDKMDVDEEPSESKPSADVHDFDANEDPQSSDWRTVVKRKYHLKECCIKLTDAQPLSNRRTRKVQKEEVEENRRSSSSLDETPLRQNKEPVADATAKKRHARLSPHKVRKRKRRSQSPTMTVQEKRLIKEMRKEKLKEIVPKANETEAKWREAFRAEAKPVVKVTDKNRGSYLMDAMIKQPALPKRPAKVEHSAKEPSLSKREKPPKSASSSKADEPAKNVAGRLPVLKEKVARTNDAKLAEDLVDRYCKDDAKPGPSRRGSFCEPKENDFANALNRIDYKVHSERRVRKNDSNSLKKRSQSSDSRPDSQARRRFESGDVPSSSTKPGKSSLKKIVTVFGPTNIYDPPKPKKKVRFHREENCRIIPWDASERKNHGIYASSYKMSENLISEGVAEFETAMAKVCSWNVKWLEEQQKCSEPPPLYPENNQLILSCPRAVKYKEELKLIMFNNLWQAIFRSWNKPDNDFLPHTQFINEKPSLGTLTIESVDTNKGDKKMWTIIASRTVSVSDQESDLSNGQVVILNFPILTSVVSGVPRKTMVFAYLAAVTKTFSNDNEWVNQRMILRISAKPFNVVLGEAKLKVLSYLKSCLRPFQALAMINRAPLTDLIVDPERRFFTEPFFDPGGDWFLDKFLDPSQRKAVANCLNCILSPEPSLCLIDGAPGTGKSQVIVSLMRELFSKNNRNQFPHDLRVLIVTAQEVVADDLSYRFEGVNKKEKFFNLLRYGHCRNMHATVKNCTLEKRIQDLLNEDHGNQLINLDEEKNNLKAKIHSIKLVLDSTSAKPEKITEAKLKLTNNEREWNDMESENSKVIEQLKSQVAKEISIESADVILTSLYSCWTSSFEQDFIPTRYNKGDVHKFTVCIFDDASLINETAMLVPIMLMVRSLILVGDHRNQLTISKTKSPFSRLLNDCAKKAPSAVTELNFQYRSPHLITQWVDEFYDIKCKPKNSPPPASKLKIKPLLVLDLLLPTFDDINYRYEVLANYCSSLVEKLNQLVDDASVKFGIIVAQSSQKDIIKGSRGLFERGRKVIVETLDEFSGREQDVVILCLPYHYSQYASWLYVAATRARCSLFVCGDFAQLKAQECVNSLVKFAKNRELYSLRAPFESDIPSNLILSSSK